MISISKKAPKKKGEKMELIRLNHDKIPNIVMGKYAELYCKIWKEPPWDEEFWTKDQVLEDIRLGMSKNCADGFIAVCKCQEERSATRLATVVGFTWGYMVSQQDLRDISGGNNLDVLFQEGVDARVFYVDELGVDRGYRDKGIGNELSSQLLSAAKNHGASVVTLRTDEKAMSAQKLYMGLGFQNLLIKDERYPGRNYWRLTLKDSN
jgi:ribosomal protein S18 acetylase RimI-like enzyme